MQIEKFGFKFEEGTPLWLVHLFCYREKTDVGERAFHFKSAVTEIWGPHNEVAQFVWHPWADDMLIACLENRFVALVGSGSSGKSAFMALWLLVNFYADPYNTLCVCATTSIGSGKQRIWAAVTKYYVASEEIVGADQFSGIVEHPNPFIYGKIDGSKVTDRGVLLIASEKGQNAKKSGKMRGFKVGEMDANARPRRGRFFLALDEMTDVEHTALKTAIGNLSTNPFFHMIGAANPVSYFDPFGVFCEPEDGWDSITVEDYTWNLNPKNLMGGTGVALHFDAFKSPNFIAKEDIWPLASWKTVQAAIDTQDPNSPEFWREFRGFWAPAGASNTIYTEADLLSYGAYAKEVEWLDKKTVAKFAGVDPAYTAEGDRCAVSIVSVGLDINAKWRVHIEGVYSVYIPTTAKKLPHNEAVAKEVHNIIKENKVADDHVAIDISSGGAPWGTIYTMVSKNESWFHCNFQGGASLLPISTTDRTPGKERYANRMTEIWFAGREMLRNYQLSGVTPDLSFEMVNRKYSTTRSSGNMRLIAESKKEMRKRMDGKSPDLGDATFIALDCVKNRAAFRVGMASAKSGKSAFRSMMDKKNVSLISRQQQGTYESPYV
jgi:hypothetical protein